ncbi:MAG: penicillin acylase family protein, partial [Ignavibacteriales bacterium]|nr:penicillin acylase family protein [Ignavibacteriales bacterium]
DYDWKGYIPHEKLPLVFNPAAGFLASANNKPEGSYDFYISNSWEPDSRIDRIKQLLSSKDKHSIKDFREYQSDIISPYANSILPYILAAFDSVRIRHNNLETALELLSHWDSRMHSRSQAPAIFNTFKYFFIKNLFSDDLDEELLNEYLMISSNSNRVVSAFLKGNDTLWFDDKRTDEIEGKNEIIRRSMAEAISWLENELGKELAEWQWGKIHKVTLKHLFHGQLSILDRFIDSGPYEAGGDGTTIFNTDFSFTNPFDVRVGQTLRFLYDFGNPNELQVVLPGGQSGHLLKDSYKDQTELWLKGRNIVLDISGSDTQKYFPLLTLISRHQD